MAGCGFLLRDGAPGDAEELTGVLLRSHALAMPWLRSPHDEPSTRWWVQHVLLAEQQVRVAREDDRLLGFAALVGNWLEQLYVDPETRGGASEGRCSRTPSAPDPPDCTYTLTPNPVRRA